jgi:glycosyltransferase 2 family protein
LIKTALGFGVSAFFLWFTFHKISFRSLLAVHIAHPGWLAAALISLACGYTLRIHRWWRMLRFSAPVSFRMSGLVLLSSFAANNIFPLRVGDLMRVFSHSKDLKAHPSTILSTVVLERILDLLALLTILLVVIENSTNFPWPRAKLWASIMLFTATAAMIALIVLAEVSNSALQERIGKMPDTGIAGRLKRSLAGGLNAFRNISLIAMLGLMTESLLIWAFEGVVFVSAARALDLAAGWIAPWQALVLSNLSTLLPSSPGYVGTFDYAAKLALTSHGVTATVAGFYALLVHALVWLPITFAGGLAFLALRYTPGEGRAAGRVDEFEQKGIS